ncbi:MAG: response regulator, partial [Syntrophobacterales bacterium]
MAAPSGGSSKPGLPRRSHGEGGSFGSGFFTVRVKKVFMPTKRILIVDDEPDLLETIQVTLEMEGYECLVAYDGFRGLDRARTEKPDLIVLDVMLPGLNGYKICRLLKFDEQYKRIPIIMLTAEAQEKDRLIAEETGADYYMTKPFAPDKLIAKVAELLEK